MLDPLFKLLFEQGMDLKKVETLKKSEEEASYIVKKPFLPLAWHSLFKKTKAEPFPEGRGYTHCLRPACWDKGLVHAEVKSRLRGLALRILKTCRVLASKKDCQDDMVYDDEARGRDCLVEGGKKLLKSLKNSEDDQAHPYLWSGEKYRTLWSWWDHGPPWVIVGHEHL